MRCDGDDVRGAIRYIKDALEWLPTVTVHGIDREGIRSTLKAKLEELEMDLDRHSCGWCGGDHDSDDCPDMLIAQQREDTERM